MHLLRSGVYHDPVLSQSDHLAVREKACLSGSDPSMALARSAGIWSNGTPRPPCSCRAC